MDGYTYFISVLIIDIYYIMHMYSRFYEIYWLIMILQRVISTYYLFVHMYSRLITVEDMVIHAMHISL